MLALAAFAGQGNADTTEWTRVSGSEIIMDGEFWNTGQWTNGTPDATKDVVMNDSAMPNVKLCGKDSVLEMRSLTIREKDSMSMPCLLMATGNSGRILSMRTDSAGQMS